MSRTVQVGIVIGALVLIDILFHTLSALLGMAGGAARFTNLVYFSTGQFGSTGQYSSGVTIFSLTIVLFAVLIFIRVMFLVTRIFFDLILATKHIMRAVFLGSEQEADREADDRRLIVRLFGDDEIFGGQVVPGIFWRVMRNLFYTWLLLILLQLLSGIAAFGY